jgi:hypothetical protein
MTAKQAAAKPGISLSLVDALAAERAGLARTRQVTVNRGKRERR